MAVGVVQNGAAKIEALNGIGQTLAEIPVPGIYPNGIRVVSSDVTGDGIIDYVVVPGPGAPATAFIYNGANNALITTISPFGDFTGGMFAAVGPGKNGDIDGDGRSEIVLTPDEGGGPRVVVVHGGDFATIASFLGIDDPNFRGGARPALGDITSDGKADVIVAAGFGGGPRLSLFDGVGILNGLLNHPFNDFFVFEPTLRNGVFIAAGDVNGDNFVDLLLGGGPGGGPRVEVMSGALLLAYGPGPANAFPLMNFFAGSTDQRKGVHVASKDLDGNGKFDVLAGSGNSGQILGFRGDDGALIANFTEVDDTAALNGIYVG